jgi:hypothetical protein
VKSGGTCTATGDCCTGLVCNISPGAPAGTCAPPPPTGGGDGSLCALYGQNCGSDVPCCNGTQCMYAPTNTACVDQGDCTCYIP